MRKQKPQSKPVGPVSKANPIEMVKCPACTNGLKTYLQPNGTVIKSPCVLCHGSGIVPTTPGVRQ